MIKVKLGYERSSISHAYVYLWETTAKSVWRPYSLSL